MYVDVAVDQDPLKGIPIKNQTAPQNNILTGSRTRITKFLIFIYFQAS